MPENQTVLASIRHASCGALVLEHALVLKQKECVPPRWHVPLPCPKKFYNGSISQCSFSSVLQFTTGPCHLDVGFTTQLLNNILWMLI
eukprot:6491556-Amphidinium_carterae.2